MTQPHVDGLRLLLVEDEYLLAAQLAEILEELGAEIVGPVGSVEDALQLLDHDDHIDIGILDVDLRGETTEPIADLLTDRGVPFVFASGYARDMLPALHRDAPLCGKPIDPMQLATTVASLRH